MTSQPNNRDNYFVHSNGLVDEGAKIGAGTRVWAFAHILPGATIGKECNICDHVFIENEVKLGDRVTVKCGVQIWDGIEIEDDVFIGPNATFTNDKFPRSMQYLSSYPLTKIGQGASIGANATILPGISIGREAMIGAGSVVTKDVPPYAIVMGNPARIKGYVTTTEPESDEHVENTLADVKSDQILYESKVSGVKMFNFPVVTDLRGSLTFGEYDKHLPFVPKRFFLIYDVPTKEIRGEHAHAECHQLLICVSGSCEVLVDDSLNRELFILKQANNALYIPPMVWAAQFNYSSDSILMVLASDAYAPEDYIRDYPSYLQKVRAVE